MTLDILIYPDKRLREVSQPVDPKGISDPKFQKLIDDMFETMYAAPGVGLAAVQVGFLQRVMVMDIGISEGEVVKRDPRVVINPEYVHQEGSVVWEEGCLSCPDLVVPMQRFQKVKIHSLDRQGQPQEMAGVDLLAVAIQHEIDHMDGKLILDQLSSLKKNLYAEKIQKGKIAIR
jgi:peptide deformylase